MALKQTEDTMEARTEITDVADLVYGDTIIVGGQKHTSGRNDRKSGIMGTTVRGQCFPHGIEVVLYPRWRAGTFVGFSRQ